MGQAQPIERVIAYIDGFNVYYGMMAKGWGRYRWLDYRALVERHVLGHQELVGLKYFTTRVTHKPESLHRQEAYLRALEMASDVQVISGSFEHRRVKCQGTCGEWYRRPQEKKTDVNLATHLVADSYEDLFDVALLYSADADLGPAVELIRERHGRRVVLFDPPKRHSRELADLSDRHLHVSKQDLARSQLPDPVEWVTPRGKTRRVHRPPSWAPELGAGTLPPPAS